MVRFGLALALLLSVLAITALLLWPNDRPTPATGLAGAAIAGALQALEEQAEPSKAVDPDRPLRFPADQAPHPQAPAELWDLSGLVTDERDRRFGIRLSFIRVALAAADAQRPSRFAAQGVIAAQLGIAPEGAEAMEVDLRVSRTALGLAGIMATAAADTGPAPSSEPPAESAPARTMGEDMPTAATPAGTVWVEDWRLQRHADGRLTVTVATESMALDLALTPDKAPVSLDDAEMQDGPDGAETAIRLYLEPRLTVAGSLTLDGERHQVSGTAWLDHAWGALVELAGGGPGRLALNRFQLQLEDGSELACVHLRRRGGGGTPIPSCIAIAPDGGTRVFRRRDLSLEPFGQPWSTAGGSAEYPLRWRLEVPALQLELALKPLIDDQELALLGPVWSGIVVVDGRHGDTRVNGTGRMDLSGYATADPTGT